MEYDLRKFKEKAAGLNNVLIIGYKPPKEIPCFLRAADVLVLPNSAKDQISSYTSPLKLFEYMASNRPIVASGLSSIKEILNGENSILVKPDDPESLKWVIDQVLNSPALAEKLAKKARIDVEKYTWKKRSASIINFIL